LTDIDTFGILDTLTTVDDRPIVLFACIRNAGRSQMAAGLAALRSGDRVRVRGRSCWTMCPSGRQTSW
jgi:hypothetical protein